MHSKRHFKPLLIAVAAACAAPGAWAIGWGRAAQTAVLGAPLDFPVSLRLDPGDVVQPECVTAEVTVGDVRVPPPSVRVVVDTSSPDALGIRVQTAASVEEPVVSVLVGIGCPTRMSRRFTLLADPPNITPMPVQLMAAALPTVAPRPSQAASAVAAAPGRAASAPAAPAPRPRASAPAPRPTAVPVAQAETVAAPPPPRPPRPRREASPAPAPVAAAPAPVSRLRLDAAEPPPPPPISAEAAVIEQALEAVALAASAARQAASAASAAEARIATLERTVAELRAEQSNNAQVVGQLRSQLAEAESASRWAKPVALAATALLLLAGWLAWRLRSLDAERQRAWRIAAEAQERAERAEQAAGSPGTTASQLPMVTTEIPQPAPAPAPSAVFVPLPDDPGLDIPMARTDVMPVGSSAETGAPRDVTIEELLDLEQQAEFFIVLGQDEAAIDLLVQHLRNTGGGSPLPYLKLLEIYRRRGDREAYERTRARFNHRFNAYAPDWDTDLQQGRSLEDYPGVLPRLQQVWPRPLDAMAELEALLFRKSRGELFELPAYREVLFLYQLARDLLDREAADRGAVDLLLPLADGPEFGTTSPGSYFAAGGDSVFDPGIGGRVTAPVDLDLSQPDTPAEIVKPLRPKA